MNELKQGEFFGNHFQKTKLDHLVITDTAYTHDRVDWHYHENPYFTYLLQGQLLESNKKNTYYLEQGSLLFHNWQDAHYNIKPPVQTRGFHIELNKAWFEKYELSLIDLEGSIQLKNPMIKEAMNKIFLESKYGDKHSNLSIEILLLEIFNKIKREKITIHSQIPKWVKILKDMLLEEPERCTNLSSLAKELNIHPGHLSRDFKKYFDTTLGDFVRKQKVNKSAILIASSSLSMTQICYDCGFYDQSHFISNFKKIFKMTPLKFKKKIGV